MNTTDVKSMNFTELSAALSEMGLPSYRAKQIYSWIHQKCALDYDEMTNLPLSLREKLKEELPLKKCTIERKQVSAEDGTRIRSTADVAEKSLMKIYLKDGYVKAQALEVTHGKGTDA